MRLIHTDAVVHWHVSQCSHFHCGTCLSLIQLRDSTRGTRDSWCCSVRSTGVQQRRRQHIHAWWKWCDHGSAYHVFCLNDTNSVDIVRGQRLMQWSLPFCVSARSLLITRVSVRCWTFLWRSITIAHETKRHYRRRRIWARSVPRGQVRYGRLSRDCSGALESDHVLQ
jgi:hypothetical protein